MLGVEQASERTDSINIARSLDELGQLVIATGDEVVGRMTQRLSEPHPVTYLGKGKLEDIKNMRSSLRFDAVVADDELSPVQQRRLEEELDLEVADRTAVILHLFAQRARSREGKLQVELAQYRYRLPRLTGRGVELSRLGAGINTRGPGETKLEIDRRRIRERISALNHALDSVRSQRSLHRRQRSDAGLPVFALAGYTNAGKSTIMNVLTEAGVLSSNVLFATLDPTTRQLTLDNQVQVLLTDTVGFIQKLPADLVAAFRATLEELQEADCVMHVLDASDPDRALKAGSVEAEIEQLGVATKPRITVLNKVDEIEAQLLPLMVKTFPNAVAVSALTGFGLDALKHRMYSVISAFYVPIRVQIPHTEGEAIDLFHRRGVVESENHRAGGTTIVGKLPPALLSRFERYELN